jgi:hypothetical protein
MWKPSAPAFPVAVIPLAPLLLLVLLLLVVLLVVLVGEVTLVQETLEGTEKFCASVRSAHWVEKEDSATTTYDMWRMSKTYLVEATVTATIQIVYNGVGTI